MQIGADGLTPGVTQRLGDTGWLWNATTAPRYGDVAAYRDEKSDYIYTWGGAPISEGPYPADQYVYLARVQASNAFDLASYEYWWGDGWRPGQVLSEFGQKTATWWGTAQGQVLYSTHWGCYVFVHLGLCKCCVGVDDPAWRWKGGSAQG